MIGNETGLLLRIMVLSKKLINKSESFQNIASSLKILCQNVNSVKRCDETNITVFCIKSMEKIQVGLNFFWPVY